jgi:hypothetical protein
LKIPIKKIFLISFVLFSLNQYAQHYSKVIVDLDAEKKILTVYQELTYNNKTNDTLSYIILNDWMNAYSDKNSPLGKRFSDEFTRTFHLAKEKERGNTSAITVFDENKSMIPWQRPEYYLDLVKINLKNKILPYQSATFTISYVIKIPSDQFTSIGYSENGNFCLKNWLLTPARYNTSKHSFNFYDNLNLDDASNSLFSINLKITTSGNYKITSDLIEVNKNNNSYLFEGKNQFDVPLYIEKNNTFSVYKNQKIETVSNINDEKVNDIQKAILVDKIVNYVTENLGEINSKKVLISQIDYEKNPFYGLNQLPSFISPFPDDFVFELKILKTFLNNYLKNTLQLDERKNNWIFDAIQVYYMMNYIDENYPNAKMMGNLSKMKLLKSYKLTNIDFNEQYSYYYMLMARKNLDQPLSSSKDELIKFNEKIASKYRAGLSFKYLSEYLGKQTFEKSLKEFIKYSTTNQVEVEDLYAFFEKNSSKKIDWFKNIIINSRKIIDYQFDKFTKTKETISFKLINKTDANVPIPIYGLKNNKIIFKEWINDVKPDSTYTLKRYETDKIVINYKNEVPEFNQRNNWKSLKPFRLTNKPIKFNFLKDLEDPFYNQIIYMPTFGYNLYDGIILGMRFENKTLLDKPFIFEINPSLSTNSKDFSGSAGIIVNQYYRNSNLFNVRYGMSGNYFHYAPDATYQKYNPYVYLNFRNDDYRDNTKKTLVFRQVYVNREKSNFVLNNLEGEYSVFNSRWIYNKNEVTKLVGLSVDFQAAEQFGKISTELNYRKLFDNNHLLTLRMYAGTFIYKSTNSDYFNFNLDRPTDYLFDYPYLGRSETTGLFSQQFIMAEGGFKSKLENASANQWVTTLNAGINIWNWIEVYGDIGFIKSKNTSERFVYDNGIRFNLVADYFELYFPIYSNNGWEIAQNNYQEKIRFVITLSPKILVNLFTRKWF